MVQKVAEQTPLAKAIAKRGNVPEKVFEPIFDDVCIHLFDEKDVQSLGGIIIPDKSSDTWANRIGYVIAVGPDCKHVEERERSDVDGALTYSD